MSNENEKTNKEELAKAEIQVEIEKTNEVVYGEVIDYRKKRFRIDVKGFANKIMQVLDFAETIRDIQIDKEYVLEIPKEFREGLENGDLWIMENAKENGKYWPNIMEKADNGKNQIVKPLGLKEKAIVQGNPIQELSQKCQNVYLQGQVQRLAEIAEATYKQVQELYSLHLDDKIGLISSAKDRLYLAMSQKDDASRTTAIQLVLADVSAAQGQVFTTFKRKSENFVNVPKNQLLQIAKETFSPTGFVEEAVSEYFKLQKYFDLYATSTDLMASAWMLMGDKYNAKQVYQQSLQKLSEVNTENISSIKNLKDKKIKFEGICDSLTEPIIQQEELCLGTGNNTDTMLIEITGKELLEAYEDGN